MEIIEPFVEIIDDIDELQILTKLELCGRVAYKSEDKITKDSAKKFIRSIVKSGHSSVLEHVHITIKFTCDRGFSHELVRHRIASYTQECVSGSTVINNRGLTIKDLYDRKHDRYGKTHNKTIRLKSCDKDGFIVPNKVVDVYYKGVADVYKVTTKLGYSINCTNNHEFMVVGGYKKLFDLRVGDYLKVNGRPSLITISDEKLYELFGVKFVNDKIINIEYLGKENVYDLSMESPNCNYVANGFIVHNSTRFCNYIKKGIVFIEPPWGFDSCDINFLEEVERQYNKKIVQGQTPQQARAFLPNCLKTEVMTTMNIREWRYVLGLRTQLDCHLQMRQLMIMLLAEFKEKLPILFEDVAY